MPVTAHMHAAARAFGMKAVAAERDRHVRVRELAQALPKKSAIFKSKPLKKDDESEKKKED